MLAFVHTPIAEHLLELKTVTNVLGTIYSLYDKKTGNKKHSLNLILWGMINVILKALSFSRKPILGFKN